jgi:hypothetical protein
MCFEASIKAMAPEEQHAARASEVTMWTCKQSRPIRNGGVIAAN